MPLFLSLFFLSVFPERKAPNLKQQSAFSISSTTNGCLSLTQHTHTERERGSKRRRRRRNARAMRDHHRVPHFALSYLRVSLFFWCIFFWVFSNEFLSSLFLHLQTHIYISKERDIKRLAFERKTESSSSSSSGEEKGHGGGEHTRKYAFGVLLSLHKHTVVVREVFFFLDFSQKKKKKKKEKEGQKSHSFIRLNTRA